MFAKPTCYLCLINQYVIVGTIRALILSEFRKIPLFSITTYKMQRLVIIFGSLLRSVGLVNCFMLLSGPNRGTLRFLKISRYYDVKGESMVNRLKVYLLLLFSTLVLVPVASAAPDAATCLGCHGSMEGAVNVTPDKYSKSVHGSFDCVMCHMALKGAQHQGLSGGKPDKAIQALAAAVSFKSKRDPIAQAACVSCHPDIYDAYKKSVHGQNVIVKKSSDGPVCTSCHGSPHYIQSKTSKESQVNHFNVVHTCGVCHEEKMMSEKYGFSAHVMERYRESFHGRKLKIGDNRAPSCASCHGSHDIMSAKDPASPVSAQSKVATCGKCHSGATPKFVAAITHQPPHPIAHYTEIGLILLTVGTFLFICIHVLLDIFADIRERLFRKGKNHE
jgi:hypothetical protein